MYVPILTNITLAGILSKPQHHPRDLLNPSQQRGGGGAPRNCRSKYVLTAGYRPVIVLALAAAASIIENHPLPVCSIGAFAQNLARQTKSITRLEENKKLRRRRLVKTATHTPERDIAARPKEHQERRKVARQAPRWLYMQHRAGRCNFARARQGAK